MFHVGLTSKNLFELIVCCCISVQYLLDINFTWHFLWFLRFYWTENWISSKLALAGLIASDHAFDPASITEDIQCVRWLYENCRIYLRTAVSNWTRYAYQFISVPCMPTTETFHVKTVSVRFFLLVLLLLSQLPDTLYNIIATIK